MTSEEIAEQLAMSYPDQLNYLKQKYGPAPENYYMDVNCTRKSTKNGRGNEGLFLHHDYEYDPVNPLVNNLSKADMARQFDYMYQRAENLTYCNYLEHLILHLKINILRKLQLGHLINDGVVNYMLPELNDWYRYRVKLKDWQKVAFDLIKDNYHEYCQLVEWWLGQLDSTAKDFDWKKLSNCVRR